MEQTQAYNGVLDLLASVTAAMASAKAPVKTSGKEGEANDFRKLLEQAGQQSPQGEQAPAKTQQSGQTAQDQPAGGETQPVQADPMTQQRQMELAAALMMQPAAQQTAAVIPQEQTQQAAAQPELIQAAQPVMAQAGQIQETPQQTRERAQPVEAVPQAGDSSETQLPQEALRPAEARQARQDAGQTGEIREKPVRAAAQTDEAQADTQEDEPLVIERPEEGQPVFRQENATYVKVSEAAPAEKTQESQPAEKQIAVQLEKALESGETKVQINLTPENLGSVQVEITRRADGAIHVVLSAEKLQTQNLLEKHAAGLQSQVAGRSQETVTVQVERRENSQGYYEGHNGQPGQRQEQNGQRQRRQQDSQHDFLQQLRLGLVPLEAV